MAVLISINGNSAGDGFLIAPAWSNYDAEIYLSTDAGTVSVTLQASPDAAGLVFSQTAVNLSTTPTVVTVHATLQSASRGDTTIEVLDGATVVASFTVTSIKHPVVNFRGRFEARFSTDQGPPNLNPIYTANPNSVVVPPGWTWGLEGEPDFVPAVGIVAGDLETPGMGRVIRLNNPVALRSHAAPVVSTVHSITGDTTSGTETFLVGDPLIGQPVNFGPDTYFAGNMGQNPPPLPGPAEEYWSAAAEPLALFELHFGNLFSGASQVGPFVAKSTAVNQSTRTPDSRPIADGIIHDGAAERTEFGLPDLQTFSDTRVDALIADYDGLPVGDSPDRRNLARRIGHLLGDGFGSSLSPAKKAQVEAHPANFTGRRATLSGGWSGKEIYGGLNEFSGGTNDGRVDTNLQFNPGVSSVVAFMSDSPFSAFNVEWRAFAFHSDELCGHHKGFLTVLNFDGSYAGDPHTRTVDGTTYDFQAVGEFTLLRDGTRLEIQTRQTPVPTQNPITDSYTGLTSCVSVNTAVAARLGKHRIALQPDRERKQLQFYLDGKPASLSTEGIDLDGHRVTAFDANGETGLRVDCDDQTVLTFTPAFWNSHNIWYINVSVSNTKATEGIMGLIPRDSWLPRLRNGKTVGPKPTSLHDRYVALYKTFVDSWRVTDKTSLFVYAQGTSTKTFTDSDWPAEKPPCKLKPEFQIPGAPIHKGIPIAEAAAICSAVTVKDLHKNCVFDVATTGDKIFAKGYLLAQELRLYGTLVQIAGHGPPIQSHRLTEVKADEPSHRPDNSLVVTAKVVPQNPGRPVPTGCITFFVDGVSMNRPVELDDRGRARVTVGPLEPGDHRIRATYVGGGKYNYHSSSSRNLLFTVDPRKKDEYCKS